MDDLDRTILETYLKILPTLSGQDLRARLARRKTAALNRPPRPWCLAIRASDTRINNHTAIIIPYRAINHPTRPDSHEVTLTAPLIRILCQPVEIEPNTDWTNVAKRLGVHPESLRHTMRSGRFRVHHYPRLHGKRGKPVSVFLNFETLDPTSGRLREPTDPIWGNVWRYAAARIPETFQQPVQRRPVYALYQGDPRFRGYRWLCPRCERLTRMLYCPLPPYDIPTFLQDDPARRLNDSSFIRPPSSFDFACHHCHRIRFFTRMNRDCWNHFITHVTAGLLYGREVPRPKDFILPTDRKRKYRPSLRPPSPRREQVRTLLLQGHSYRHIAKSLNVGYATVHAHVKTIYKQNNVHSRAQLVKKQNAAPSNVEEPPIAELH